MSRRANDINALDLQRDPGLNNSYLGLLAPGEGLCVAEESEPGDVGRRVSIVLQKK